jgi:CHAD domain-containing protein
MRQNGMLEQEVKFDAPFALALPDLRPLVGKSVRLPEVQQVSRYFDTVDHRLWRQGMTIRHRSTSDRDEGTWTLKLPQSPRGPALRRTEVTWTGSSREVPTDARALLRGVLRREPLRPLTVLETTRQRLLLRDNHDHELAELDDDVVLVVGGPRSGTRFRQVEVEFRDINWKGGKVLRRLEKAGARLQNDPKLAKAIDLPRQSRPHHALDERSTMGDVVLASLRAGLDRLIAHDWQLRLDPAQPPAEDVHQARVATRRLRSDLKTFGAVLDPLWLRHVRNDLKWLGTALGELRDRDVLAEALSDASPAIRQRLAVQRLEAARQLADVLASARYVNLVDRLHAGSELLPLAPGAKREARRPAVDVVPPLVAGRWRALRRQVRRAGSSPDPAQLHGIRIKSKQLRYAAEAATPIIGGPARRTALAAEHIQTVLGEHHDAVAAEEWLREQWADGSSTGASPTVAPAVAFEAGRLVAEASQRQRESQRTWKDAWAKLRDPKRRRWLRRP